MATLKELADKAGVPMLTAFHILNNDGDYAETTRQHVLATAEKMKYSLHITQIDIADLAGVARGTVSYALNGNDLIKPKTREKVLEAAKALGYRLNITARNLRTNRASVVGYSWHVADDPSRMNNVLNQFIYRITTAAEAHKYHLLTFIQPQQEADLVYENLLASSRVDGFIISDVQYDDARIARLSSINAPFVAFGGMYVDNPQFAFVDVDGKAGMALVMNHLLEQGHEKIALMTRPPGTPYGDARERGYREAMHAAGIQIDENWTAYTPNILHSAAVTTQKIMAAKHPPTAIICTNDLMAFGAKSYLDERGLRIPDDVALAGYDDDPTSEFLGITSVRQPIDEVAYALFDILLGEINQAPVSERQVVFNPELVLRASTSS
jgi:DNA-binding LacI/PurR family transcriptional regulator